MSDTSTEFTGSVWHGTKRDGIEIRYQGGEVDEVCLYRSGDCVFHLEQMSDVCFWMGLYAAGHTAHVNVFSKNVQSFVGANADGWENDAAPRGRNGAK